MLHLLRPLLEGSADRGACVGKDLRSSRKSPLPAHAQHYRRHGCDGRRRCVFLLPKQRAASADACSILGVYRKSAEISLRILRANKDSLRSVLETFLHDPLVEWVHGRSKVRHRPFSRRANCPGLTRNYDRLLQRDSSNPPDQTKARALEALEPISNKLMGLQVTSDPESLGPKEVTIEEQVERLIREARNPHNLGSMYVGVSPDCFAHLRVPRLD